MTSVLLAAIIAPLALQAASQSAPQAPEGSSPAGVTSFDQLPIEEAASARCGVAFAVVGRWQRDGNPRGASYPNMETDGGREFFVRAIANLMESRGLARDDVARMIVREVAALDSDEGSDRVDAMMPACLLMKQSAGL